MAVSLRAKQTEVSARRGVDPSQRQHERAQAAQSVPPVTLSEWLCHTPVVQNIQQPVLVTPL